ncbi:MAG: biotin--[acetyl-CoA-carboxylase] ligase, partial [bacterium]
MNEAAYNTPILAENIERRIETKLLGKRIFAFEKLGSTNNFAKRLVQNGEGEGTLVIANHQTSGRGRYDRRWHAPANLGLWFSIVLQPRLPGEKFGILSLLAAVAVAKSVEAITRLSPELKWPNDVLVNLKKISGILIESQLWKKERDSLVLGIGVNVNQSEADFPTELRNLATSLRIESGERVDRTHLL